MFGPGSTPLAARSFLVTVAAFIVLVAGMRAAASLVVPFLLAAFIATICAPPLLWLQRKKVPTAVALLIVVAGIALLGLVFAAVVGNSVNDCTESLPHYQARIQTQQVALQEWLEQHDAPIPENLFGDYVNVDGVLSAVGSMVTGLGSMLANGFLIFLTIIFMLLEASSDVSVCI